MAIAITAAETWAARRRRAGELLDSRPYAGEMLRLYLALCDVWEPAADAALAQQPAAAELPPYVAAQVMPGVVEATLSAGPEHLKQMAVTRFHEGDLEAIVAGWLAGTEMGAVDTYLARAATAPVLEALGPSGRGSEDPRHCPGCGGLPQLAFIESTGDPLLSAPRQLLCSRCAQTWSYPRMVCASCGSTDSASQPIYSDVDQLPQIRLDACEGCRKYLLTVELTKDAASVPSVDELVGLPLDLYARERGFTKITANVMGI